MPLRPSSVLSCSGYEVKQAIEKKTRLFNGWDWYERFGHNIFLRCGRLNDRDVETTCLHDYQSIERP